MKRLAFWPALDTVWNRPLSLIDQILANLCVSARDTIEGVGESRPTIRPSFMSGNTETILRERRED